jgi:hypothetical protein
MQDGREARAPDRCALADAEERGRMRVRQDGEQRRHEDEATAADDRIDEAGHQRSGGHQQQFHWRRFSQDAKAAPGGRPKQKAPAGPALELHRRCRSDHLVFCLSPRAPRCADLLFRLRLKAL